MLLHLFTGFTWNLRVQWGGLGRLGSTYNTQTTVSVSVLFTYVMEVMWAPLCMLWKVRLHQAMAREELICHCWVISCWKLCWQTETSRKALGLCAYSDSRSRLLHWCTSKLTFFLQHILPTFDHEQQNSHIRMMQQIRFLVCYYPYNANTRLSARQPHKDE